MNNHSQHDVGSPRHPESTPQDQMNSHQHDWGSHSVLRSTFLEVTAAYSTVLGDTDTHLTNEAMPSEAMAHRTPSRLQSQEPVP